MEIQGWPWFLAAPVEAPRREARTSRPLAVFALQRQQSGAPALGGHPRALRRDDLSRRMDKIAQHLPADGGVRIEQPAQYGHAAESNIVLSNRRRRMTITLDAMPATTPQSARPRGGPLTNRILSSGWTKAAVFIACLIPAAWIVWRWQHHELGPNWIEAAERGVGDWVLKFLVLTLCVTPLRRLPGLSALIRYRRMLGLFAFAYACLHFFIYLWYDKGLDWRDMWGDFTTRRFYIFGLIAFLGLIPLALTSTAASIRWLGGKRWQLLHRLVYLSALAGAIHYYLQGKSIVPRAVMYVGIVVLLLLYRVVVFLRKRPVRRLTTT